ncbi:MAG: hypothetical protein PF795_06685 [Kiritimatiellae bacterium]|jgi:hypothetical protein|nr:hypothetical protein [Kiritimatiellia bacterium]
MKGSPLRELVLVVIAGLLLFIPLRMLTRETNVPTPPIIESDSSQARTRANAWLDVRFSHPPERVELMQRERLLWQGEGALRVDADVEVELENGRAGLDIQVVWPDSVSQAYAEFTLELEGQPAQSIGFWGKGTTRRIWNVQRESRR